MEKQASASVGGAYYGALIECRKGSDPVHTHAVYYPESKHLHVDRSYIVEGSCANVCTCTHYRVEKINSTDYWLYDLAGVEKEPEGYRFRMMLRQVM